ncbi:MFS transporter [Halalkalibacter akibai]|uniref:Major facilitator superfamily MFS_1 n=1 Tax=Halalkalibacter akibai (strain ATCC 43226 / DSM 21942 / CIP 109018 / JCM 9157 / 1139) TaxID=1236973 RepID=W4QVE9_HALA3|nr:MFS transporter [Halalkalibacter akibai]GAE36120.1 major facilitator superfamily MFS_1 [Halalkalibacter akibai JCM 9157]
MSQGSWRALLWIGLAVLFALSLWFSASVIASELIQIWNLNSHFEVWLSASVPMGFVIGALFSSYFGIADRYNPRKIFAISALLGALLNVLLIVASGAFFGILLRILTGVTLAGVYPIAVKMLSQWFPKKRGLAIGILIAALTLGSSLPHFVVMFFSSLNWKIVIIFTSVLAVLAAVIVNWILEDAPVTSKKSTFSFKLIKKVVTNKPVMLANYGYFGHMWELYAMWTWLPAFLTASFISYSPETSYWFIALSSFISIGVAGGIGCVLGGLISDKIGRSNLTIYAMLISASCAVLIGLTYGQFMWLTFILSFIWGMSVIADSAQFSAAVSEVAEPEYVGTALTFQMCIGFLITIFSINLIPIIQKYVGWEWVFALLAVGPVLGILSMVKYKRYEFNHVEE